MYFCAASLADDEDTFDCSHGGDLDDFAELDLSARSQSEGEAGALDDDGDELPGLCATEDEQDDFLGPGLPPLVESVSFVVVSVFCFKFILVSLFSKFPAESILI